MAKTNAYKSGIHPVLYFLANVSNVGSSCYVLILLIYFKMEQVKEEASK